MKNSNLRAVVIGAGWAGEGHVKALQHRGVTVEALCAREQAVVQRVADQLNVPNASVDWRQTLRDLQPEIVTIATPASLRRAVVEEAVGLGCHIFCEKPLAVDAAVAQYLYELVNQAGVCHAYGTAFVYEPFVAWMAELLAHGTIGKLQAIHKISVLPFLSTYKPWSWFDRLELGGGTLNNGATHYFSIVEAILGGKLIHATGSTQTLRQQAPVLPELHNFQQLFAEPPSPTEAAKLEWRECDADHSFMALLNCTVGQNDENEVVPVMIHANMMGASPSPANGWYFYGTDGILVGEEGNASSVIKHVGNKQTELPIPQRLLDRTPQTGNNLQNNWHALMADFVADIQYSGDKRYPNFEDGWRYQQWIDTIRQGIYPPHSTASLHP